VTDPGRDLDAEVAEKVMGIDLKPSRDLALARVGARYVCSTGRIFQLRTGDDLPMPLGEDLPQPEGSDSFNDRYYAHVGRFLGDRIAREVDAYRVSPPPYSSDLAAAWELVERLRQQGWLVVVKAIPDGFPFLGPDDMDPVPKVYRRFCCSLQWISIDGVKNTRRSINLHPFATGDSLPEAICRCALEAAALLDRWKAREEELVVSIPESE